MDTWSSYRLSDFLLFSEPTYLRQIELFHQWLGPWQYLGWGLVIIMPALFRLPAKPLVTVLYLIIAGLWLMAGYGFIWLFYRHINWIADYLLLLYILQSVVLIFLTIRFRQQPIKWSSQSIEMIVLWLFAAAGMPTIEWLLGYEPSHISRFLITPDSLAMATLVLISMTRQHWIWSIPAMMLLIISVLTWLGLNSPSYWLPLIAIGLFAIERIRRYASLFLSKNLEE